MSDAGGIAAAVAFFTLMLAIRLAAAGRGSRRRRAERAFATGPRPIARAAATNAPAASSNASGPRPAAPRSAAPRPKTAPAAPVAPARPQPPLGRSAGPRWAANAIVAAEVFGPPVAARPGGTLGPPHAL